MFNKDKIPILMYHSIDNSNSVISITPAKFKSQMCFFRDSGYKVISLNEIILSIKDRQPFMEKAVVITFDDGFKNLYTEAFPILQECGFVATVFLTTNYVGKSSNWPGQPDFIKPQPLLSWGEIIEMSKYGIEFGAHTLNHPYLPQINLEDAEHEILQSKVEIEDRIQKSVEFFAYPYGFFDKNIEKIVSSLFLGSCSTELAFANSRSNPHLLERLDAYYIKNDFIQRHLLSTNVGIYIKARNLLREFRSKSVSIN